jgi:hypothetical protein
LKFDDGNEDSPLYSYQHFKIKRIVFQECVPTAELLEAVGEAFRRKRPSILRFLSCSLRSEVEMALIQLLCALKNGIKVIVFKECHSVDAITHNFIKELDRVDQFVIDPCQNANRPFFSGTLLDIITQNFKMRPFHLTLPRKCFDEYEVQQFLKVSMLFSIK